MYDHKIENEILKVSENYQKYLNFASVNFLKKLGLNSLPQKASGALIQDIRGNEYIDCIGGYGIQNTGHNHPVVVNAIKKVLDENNLLNHPFLNKYLSSLACELARLTPGDLECSFICNSGSEAIDSALKLARLYTGKTEIIAANNAFHGYTYGALSVSGIDSFKKYFHPLLPDVIHVPFNNVDAIANAITDKTAAIILEPIQHESGIKIPSEDYLLKVSEICAQKNILFIVDEIKTGFGKTGKFFACEHFNVTPDILVLGKSMSSGIIPIGAIIARRNLWRKFSLSFPMSASSFAGNSLACVSALSTIKIIQKENLLAKCQKNSKYLLDNLQLLQKAHPEIIKEVCGMGMLIGVGLINSTKALDLVKEIIFHSVLVMQAFGDPSVIMVEPPLCLTKEQTQKIVSAFESALWTFKNKDK